MAPALVAPEEPPHVKEVLKNGIDLETNGIKPVQKRQKLYILPEFHPEAVKHTQELFDCVLHTDPEAANWRKSATTILIKDYYITDGDLAAAPQLRVIGKHGVGLDKVDVEACRTRGEKVCNTPGVNAGAVAEMTLALAMSVARSIPSICYRQIANGEVIRKETVQGVLLGGKTIGIVGMGNIGEVVGNMFWGAFGSPIIAYDPYYGTTRPWTYIPHRRVHSLDDLLEVSDVVNVHVPLTPGTTNLISLKEMRKMKRTAILLNTARGGIVDEDDLIQALDENLIYGAGFDSHVQEPPTKTKYECLWNHDRFVGTPHIAAATDETQVATTNAATDGVLHSLSASDS
ncbi:uncharacterized protein PV06_00012 [Exophiala oligosperma]|uniref:D-3-phosphoglycerate dehydrogenase n=2 Tax=Chaetothyriales TaxID=34395 RepID=A0A0D2B4W8_9EURO|nr:uncharacterized protein PV06_00012 [Exophiala oligosperma]KAJ9619706.1 hypothetical protein H2204_012574 [Knufia peltigerae]KIW47301.1 hypothetical protein PV06_00012 [Exophiala oligosperma]